MIIFNDGKAPITITLLHNIYCKKAGICTCKIQSRKMYNVDKVSGERKVQEKIAKVPKTLILPVGCRATVHESIRMLPDFKKVIRGKGNRRLKIMTEKKDPVVQPKKKRNQGKK